MLGKQHPGRSKSRGEKGPKVNGGFLHRRGGFPLIFRPPPRDWWSTFTSTERGSIMGRRKRTNEPPTLATMYINLGKGATKSAHPKYEIPRLQATGPNPGLVLGHNEAERADQVGFTTTCT